MRRYFQALLIATLAAILSAGCAAPQASNSTAENNTSVEVPAESQHSASAAGSGSSPAPAAPGSSAPGSASSAPASLEESLQSKAAEIVDILRNRDLERLSGKIHPEAGLTFSPYAYIDTESALKFGPQDLPGFQDSATRIWGSYDGSGEPIELTFREYFENFVYNRDFASAPEIHVNTLKGIGNSPFNGLEIFPGAAYVEYHFPGFEKEYEGMDWESLILILLPYGSDWKLCAIVHAGWTI